MKNLTALLSLLVVCATQAQDEPLLAGMSAMRKADHATAAIALDKAVAEAPTNGRTWYYRAVNKMAMGDNDGALRDLDHLLTMEPRDVHAMLRRAEVHTVLGDADKATIDLYRVIGTHANGPATEQALSELGRMAMAAQDIPSALGHYDRLVEIAGYNAMAWCDRGIARSVAHDDDRAVADLEKAIDLDPTLDKAYGALAVVYFRQGRKQEGCYALQQARDLGDRSVEELLLLRCDQ
ncbi:MAG TPA: tetratricopeptide repeat protein [Flavobacteriales bacterium]|nr:tetratricopeptide repeat protein [Flavobacteriales bacterium]